MRLGEPQYVRRTFATLSILLAACQPDPAAPTDGKDDTTPVDTTPPDPTETDTRETDTETRETDTPQDTEPSDADGDGIFGTFDGEERSFTVTPTVLMAFQGGAGSPPLSARLTAGDASGATMTLQLIGTELVPGTYTCGATSANLASYLAPGALSGAQATGTSGACSITLEELGDFGERLRGTFSATLIPFTGGDPLTLTEGRFSVPRTQN